MEICNLCAQPRILRKSHVFPKFIFKWLKETGTGKLRGSWNYNQRVQDGIKITFLCSECENLFSKAETYFSKEIFYPVVNERSDQFNYNDKLFYFAVSVFWRLLKYDILNQEQKNLHYSTLLNAEKEWREYLFNGHQIKNFNRLHLLIAVDPLRSKDLEENNITVPERFVQYMGRMTDGGIADNDEVCMIYIKLPRFMFILPLIGFDEEKLVNTRISESEGIYILEQAAILDSTIGDFFIERVKTMNKMFDKISPAQRKKMRQKTVDEWDEILKKDLGKIIEYSRKNYPD